MIIQLNTCNIYHHRNAYKANVLLLLLSNLVTQKLFTMQHKKPHKNSFEPPSECSHALPTLIIM